MSALENNKSLSATAKYAIELLKALIEDIISGRCSEEEIDNIITRTEPRHNGYIKPADYLSADKAMRYLGVYRSQLFNLLKKHKVKVHKVNNLPIGYYIKDLDRIKYELEHSKA